MLSKAALILLSVKGVLYYITSIASKASSQFSSVESDSGNNKFLVILLLIRFPFIFFTFNDPLFQEILIVIQREIPVFGRLLNRFCIA